MVEVPSAPALATVPGVELCSVGFWNISTGDDWHPSAEDLAAAVAALDCPAMRRPCLKFGHTGTDGEGDPSIGLIDNLRLTEDGQTLVGDFVGVPAWFAESDDQGRAVIASAYPDRSGEFYRDFVCQNGHTHPFVMAAVALLGVETPGVGTLESLYDLYTKAPEKETAMAKASTIALAAGTSIDDVRREYYDGPGSSWYLWIREMFIDPPELIVQNDDADTLERVPYTITGEGEVEFGEGQAVKVEYVAARASSEKPAVAFASRTEARPGQQQSAGTDSASADKGKEGAAVPTVNHKDGLTQLLGIPADADDETLSEALTSALAAKDTGGADPAPDTDDEGADEGADELAAVVAAAAKAGMAVIPASRVQTLEKQASDGATALANQVAAANAAVIDDAISKGKIGAGERAEYLTLMASNADTVTKILNATPAEARVPLTEVGHGTEAASTTGENNPLLKELI